MSGEVASAGLGAGASIGASIINNVFARKENEKNRNWQREMYDLSVQNNRQDAETAFGHQKELMELQAQKNLEQEQKSYLAKMKGIKEAGINPAFALGMGGTQGVSAPNTPQASAASAGSPQTFNPATFMDISASIKNIAEAGLAEAKTKTETGIQTMQEEQINNIKADTDKKRKEIEEIDSKINLNELAGIFQGIQNEIANDTKGTQKGLIRQGLQNARQEYNKLYQEVQNLGKEREYKQALIEYTNAQTDLVLAQKWGQNIQNKRDQKTFEDVCRIMKETANKIAAETKNEKEFRERWEKEMDIKRQTTNIQQFVAKNKSLWTSFVGAYNALWTGDSMNDGTGFKHQQGAGGKY